jgi:hypothetical protein
MGKLNDLMNRYGTDKGDGNYDKHGYANFYEELIGLVPERGTRPFSLLEVGVWDPRNPGASMRAWREFLPRARLLGMDINPECAALARECNAEICVIDQRDKGALERAMIQIGPVDVIIDDGSHDLTDIVASLQALWRFVDAGGFYFIEDLHAPQAQPKDHLITVAASLGVSSGMWLNEKLLVFRKDV